METVGDFNFWGSKITADGDCSHEIKRHLPFGRKAMINLNSILKSRDITLPAKVHLVKARWVMYGCESWDYKESWELKNWCFWTVVLEKTLESPLDCKEIQPVHPKGDQSWILTGRTDAEIPILWPPDVKNWLIGTDPDSGKDWRWEEKGMTEDEMVGWHHWLMDMSLSSSGSCWWTEKPGVLQSMGSQRVRRDWSNELNWTELNWMESERTSLIAQLVESTCNARDPGLIPRLGRSTGEEIGSLLQYSWVSLVAQMVKNLPAMQETWVRP